MHDIVKIDENVIVTVPPGLLVKESDRMHHLVDGCRFRVATRSHGDILHTAISFLANRRVTSRKLYRVSYPKVFNTDRKSTVYPKPAIAPGGLYFTFILLLR